MGNAGEADPLSSCHRFASCNVDLAEIGDRDLQPGHRLDCHGLHPGNRSCKHDGPRCGGEDRIAVARGEVYTPVTAVLADWGEPSNHRPGDRGTDTDSYRKQELENALSLLTLPNVRGN